jgi:hypothetical protein
VRPELSTEQNAPLMALWIENADGYLIHVLYVSEGAAGESWTDADGRDHTPRSMLPYWGLKRDNHIKAKREATERGDVDGVTTATPNSSFRAADYILPDDQEYALLLEVNQPYDVNEAFADPLQGQPSVVYSVAIKNREPRLFQVMERLGHVDKARAVKQAQSDYEDMELVYDRSTLTSAQTLIDSVLVRIIRSHSSEGDTP